MIEQYEYRTEEYQKKYTYNMHISSQIITSRPHAHHQYSRHPLKLKKANIITHTTSSQMTEQQVYPRNKKSLTKDINNNSHTDINLIDNQYPRQIDRNVQKLDSRQNCVKEDGQMEVQKMYDTITQRFKQQQQNYKARTVILSKFKIGARINASISGTDYKKQKQKKIYFNCTNSKDREKIISNISTIINVSPNTNKLFEEQIKKQSAMISGIEQYDKNKKKNKIAEILNSNNFTQISNQKHYHSKNNSNYNQVSVLGPVFQDQYQLKRVENQRKQLKELIQNRDSQILENLLKHMQFKELLYDDNLGCQQVQRGQFYKSESMPCSPSKQQYQKQNKQYRRIHNPPKKPLTKKQIKSIKQTLQNKMKYNLSKKIEYVKRLNNICQQVKNNQNKLNNYFKEIGEKYSHTQKIDYPDLKYSRRERNKEWEKLNFVGNFKKSHNKYHAAMHSSVPLSARKQNQKQSNKIPTNFLKTLRCFYTSDKKDKVQRIKNMSNPKTANNKNLSDEFRSQRHFKILHSSTPDLQVQNHNIINRKDLRICQKVKKMEKQRVQQKQSIKISPVSMMNRNFSNGLFQNQSVYRKIVQYF